MAKQSSVKTQEEEFEVTTLTAAATETKTAEDDEFQVTRIQ